MNIDISKRRLFVQWAVMASLIVAGSVIALQLGYGAYLEAEPTRITYATLGIFALGSALCGSLCWRLCGAYRPARITKGLKYAAFGANLCVYMGLFGTAVGYYIMLKSGNMDGDPKEVIKSGFDNTSIAIINTIVGCVTSILLQIQATFAKVEFEYLEDLRDEIAIAAAPQADAASPEGGGA